MYLSSDPQAHFLDKEFLMKAIIQKASNKFHRKDKVYRALIAGMPNVGKSSLVNSLRRVSMHKKGTISLFFSDGYSSDLLY